ILVLHAALSWPSEIPKYASRGAVRPQFPDWRAALRLTPDSEFLNRRRDDYGLELLIEAKTAPHDRIFAFGGFAQAYHSRQVLVEWQSALGVRLGQALRSAIPAGLQPVEHFDFRFEPLPR